MSERGGGACSSRPLALGILLTAAIVVSLALAEGVLRIAAPQETMFPRYVASSEFEIELPPNETIRHRRGRMWQFTYTTNEIGRRGPYVPVRSAYDVPNLVLLGDSFTFGQGVNDGEEFASVLATLIGDEWTVINGAVGGWGLDSQIKWFCRTGMDYRPAAVVLQFTTNDPADSDTGVTTLQAGAFEFHPFDAVKPSWQAWLSASALIQRSHLYSLLRSAMGTVLAAPQAADEGAATEPPVEGEGGTRYAAYLRAFAARLHDRGIPFFFVSVTGPRADGYRYDLADHPLIEAEVARLEASGRLHFVDLPVARMAGMPGSPEGHQWDVEHHRLVAEALAEAIRQRAPETGTEPGGRSHRAARHETRSPGFR